MDHPLITKNDAAWNQTSFLKAVQTFLILSIDSRPKPRRRAQEVVRNIIRSVWSDGLLVMTIVAFVPGADKKLLVNIMKRRERAKRKKAQHARIGDERRSRRIRGGDNKKVEQETRSGCMDQRR
jgi:hypothetical protein